MDSWLNYSSTSSEDYSYVEQSLDELSNSDYEVKLKKASKINKRNYDHLDIGGSQVDVTEDEDDRHVDEELEPVNSITSTKRPKSKERKPSTSTSRRSSYNRRNSDGITDVRMIDFAHTTFVVQNGGFSLGTTNKKVGLLVCNNRKEILRISVFFSFIKTKINVGLLFHFFLCFDGTFY